MREVRLPARIYLAGWVEHSDLSPDAPTGQDVGLLLA